MFVNTLNSYVTFMDANKVYEIKKSYVSVYICKYVKIIFDFASDFYNHQKQNLYSN